MGYYTDYTLNASRVKDDDRDRLEQNLKVDLGMEEDWSGDWYVNATWYDHEDDMRKLSRMFPDVLFTLDGRGEGRDDAWVKYFLGGKMQYCPARIEFDDFDEAKLE